ncbi:hypothetical protein QQF64_004789 [Cirrhinus molitorella]|uniref:Uncharacterized protein n=1 Tax=Cirrhinus molitorella TaxID=172907 RepID=A0ABR3MK06_9TELE
MDLFELFRNELSDGCAHFQPDQSGQDESNKPLSALSLIRAHLNKQPVSLTEAGARTAAGNYSGPHHATFVSSLARVTWLPFLH